MSNVDKVVLTGTAAIEAGVPNMDVEFKRGETPCVTHVDESATQAVPEVPKHHEHILVIHREDFKRVVEGIMSAGWGGPHDTVRSLKTIASSEVLLDAMEPYVMLRRRASCENNPDYVQFLPYHVIARLRHVADQVPVMEYLTYQRVKGIGEDRLLGKHSIGIGGHIDAKECFPAMVKAASPAWRNVVNMKDSVMRSSFQEFSEELRLYVPAGHQDGSDQTMLIGADSETYSHLIHQPYDEVGCVHLALVQVIQIQDNVEAEFREPELQFTGWLTSDELWNAQNNGTIDLESWSKILVDADGGLEVLA